MKKRLISLLVALCMAVTLLPVSAITAWAEESSSNSTTLRIKYGYPVGSGGEDWSYDGTTKTLKLNPTSPTEYDFSSLSSDGNTLDCALEIGAKATITSGSFTNDITNHGIVSGGTFSPIQSVKPCLTFANYGIITDGTFYAPINTPSTSFKLSNYPSGTIEGGNFRNSSSNFSFSNQGSINGGIFSTAPDSSIKLGYILKCSGQLNDIFNATCYVIPNTNSTYPTKITASFDFGALSPFDVTINNTQQMLLTEWAGKVESSSDPDRLYVTFTAPPADVDTVTLSKLTRLVIDKDGYPVGTEGGTQDYSGNGWKFDASNKKLTLTSGRYDFSGEKNALHPLNPDVNLVVESGAKLTGGAAGDGSGVTWQLTENTDDPSTYTLTIRGSGAMEDYLMSSNQPWCSFRKQITSVVVSPGVTSIGNLAFALSRNIIHVDIADSVVSIGEQVFFECSSLTNITVPQSVTYIGVKAFDSCTNLSSITLSNNITSIGTYAFNNCTNLTSITIPGSVTSIGWGAFSNCTKLTSITIPDSVTTINPCAFKNCSSLTSITIPGSVTSIGPNAFENCTNLTSITIPDSVTTIGLEAFKNCSSLNDIRYSGTSESVISALSGYAPTLVTFDYGDKVPEAKRMIKVFVKRGGTLTAPTTIPTVSGYEFKGWLTKDGKPYDFTGAPTGRFTLYANWEKIPEPKPEPKPEPTPDPTPETPTYTLTVKGGTFTYNGGEAMTSASVPVDAEVKVTLNQSAVPEGMVFDLWAMDEASLLGNPAVAYNEESFTIPAGSVAKGSTVTVEAQYRDATIESEPSVLGTAAIIGVAGAGTAVIVWQGYRIGMELYEKYFQPTPEETAAEQPAPEAPAAAAAS